VTAQHLSGIGRRAVRRPAPLRLLAAGPVLALVVAACSSPAGGGAPGFTYGPALSPSASPVMDMNPSASAPAGSATPAGSGPAPTAPVASDSAAAAGPTLHISAQNIEFDTRDLEAPAGQAFVLAFDNNDAGIPHNVEIKDANGTSMFRGQIITGPAKASYQVPALPAGTYMFLCDVHPTMTGTLTVK
jgi:plastocyanin